MKTKKFYDENPEAYEKKKAYDKKYHSTRERKAYRAFLNKKNRQAGTYGNGDELDASHTKSGKIVWEQQSVNRARNRGKK
jgi:hypothetical protein